MGYLHNFPFLSSFSICKVSSPYYIKTQSSKRELHGINSSMKGLKNDQWCNWNRIGKR